MQEQLLRFALTLHLLFAFCSAACTSEDTGGTTPSSTGDGGGGGGTGGAPSTQTSSTDAGGGASATTTSTGGGGSSSTSGGGGGAQPDCGESTCDADEVCKSCESDDWDEGTIHYCEPKPPVPAPGEFLCLYKVCQVGQYCEQWDDDLCQGNVDAYCHDSPPSCAGAAPDCDCLAESVCFTSCETDADGNVTVHTSDIIECG